MSSHVTSKELLEKSVQAALSAIEIYNKPDFRYREEAFAILMSNSWELLLKAKALADHGDNMDAIAATRSTKNEAGETVLVAKTNRSGNTLTVDVLYLAAKMLESKVKGFSKECLKNIELLVEIRDNAVHLLCDDLALSKGVLQIGTASLKNYLRVSAEWFGTDFSRYNFFLMPISFFHEFEAMQGVPLKPANAESKRMLEYIAAAEEGSDRESAHHVALTIETKVVKGKGTDGVAVRWTNDPSAPAMRLQEDDLLERYPYDSISLAAKLRERYSDFKQDARYYKIKKRIEGDSKYCRVRYLDPKNPRSGSKKFYCTEVFKVFDSQYKGRE
jgi:hypothetical protein